MSSRSPLRLIYVTVPSVRIGRAIATHALQERKAACATLQSAGESFYVWRGKEERSREHVLLLKTSAKHVKALRRLIAKMHPYECPCILSIPVESANEAYQAWVLETLK